MEKSYSFISKFKKHANSSVMLITCTILAPIIIHA